MPWNGAPGGLVYVEEIQFFDDMEDPAASEMKWLTMDGSPTGDLWHITGMHQPYSGVQKWWCGDEKSWSSYGKSLYQDFFGEAGSGPNAPNFESVRYMSDPYMYRSGMEDNLTLTLDLSDKYQATLEYYEQYDFDDTDDFGLVYVSNDGITWTEVGGTATLVSGGWVLKRIDLTPFVPGTVYIRWSFVSGMPGLPAGWVVNDEGDMAGDSWELSPPGDGRLSQYAAKMPPNQYDASDTSPYQDEWLESPVFTYPDWEWMWGGEFAPSPWNESVLTYWIMENLPWAFARWYDIEVYIKWNYKDWQLIDSIAPGVLVPGTWTMRTVILDDTDYTIQESGGAMQVQLAWRVRNWNGEDPIIFLDDVMFTGFNFDLDAWFATFNPMATYGVYTPIAEDFETTSIGWELDDIVVKAKPDCFAPVTTAILNPPVPDGCNDYFTSPVTITLDASDNREGPAIPEPVIYYSIDGGTYKTYTGPLTISLDGEHTIAYYAVDAVGNEEEAQTVSFKIDATAPTATINAPQSGYIYLFGRELFANPLGGTIIIGGITFQASASDATSGIDYVRFEVDGMTYDRASSPYEIFWHKFDLLPASYTLTVTAEDEACNEGAAATLSFTHWL
jgi:hypothetical protein